MPAYFDDRIELQAHGALLCVYAGSQQIGHTEQAIRLSERGYEDRFYLPWAAIVSDCLQRSDKQTHCPYKGDTRYYHVVIDGVCHENAGWVYPQPRVEMAAIAGRIAFDHPQIRLAGAEPA
ncbi:hypothetical protein C84B14_11991 [Salinisphaera sp. C84B14]|uniref:DUF427 domain-containing protein n=1 Tax=Salinisphaera sp. C84B14 TaxID=1304155 RepID=UPI0032B1919F|tara:strand:+ start:1001 stop:1363 length:363 start_codon:yes stop_codon:yes gene_type:complete